MKNENVILDTIVEKEFNEMKLSPKEKINYLLFNYLDRLDVEPIFQKAVEKYANQKVINSFDNLLSEIEFDEMDMVSVIRYLKDKTNKLKQE